MWLFVLLKLVVNGFFVGGPKTRTLVAKPLNRPSRAHKTRKKFEISISTIEALGDIMLDR